MRVGGNNWNATGMSKKSLLRMIYTFTSIPSLYLQTRQRNDNNTPPLQKYPKLLANHCSSDICATHIGFSVLVGARFQQELCNLRVAVMCRNCKCSVTLLLQKMTNETKIVKRQVCEANKMWYQNFLVLQISEIKFSSHFLWFFWASYNTILMLK